MSGRTTPPGGAGQQTVSSLRQRSPLMWWVAVILVVGLVLGTIGGALLSILV